MRHSDVAWIALAAGVFSYDALCDEGDTMSEACDRYMLRHPWLVRCVAFGIAGHVCNLVQPRFDIVHWFFVLSRKWRRP